VHRNQSVNAHNFAMVPRSDVPRSGFKIESSYKTTFNAGQLIPIYCEEVLPGDTFNVQSTFFGRLATPLRPFMDNMKLESFYFFVPNRLLWDNWQRFYGEQDDPSDSTDFLVPVLDKTKAPLNTTGFIEGSTFDYLGMPTKVTGIEPIAFYNRAINLIYKEWFRDQNLIESPVINKGDGPDDPADYPLLKIAKLKDYFTTALPWPQKPFAGITDVTLPLGDTAPIHGVNQATKIYTANADTNKHNLIIAGTSGVLTSTGYGSPANDNLLFSPVNSEVGLVADLSLATASTINELRQAFQIQRLLEQQARGGTRYIERLRVEFQVQSPDGRLQRPEYLGGGKTNINIHPVVQNSESGTTPQGTLAATGIVASTNNGFTKSFVEHGVVICLVAVRCDLNYVQGLERKFSRQTAFDYYRPVLAHLGEQAILNKEIYCQGTSDDDQAFGYTPRYDEYRHAISKITGLFRFNATGTLETWHLAQEFTSLPELNQDFIEENAPIDRVIAVPSQPQFIFDCLHKINAARPLPTYSVPGLIDHF